MNIALGRISSWFAVLANVSVLAACVQNKTIEVGGNISPSYLPPDTYADHRAQQELFEHEGVRIAYTDHGEGPVIVLLHGVPSSSWLFRKVIPMLQTHMRVISVDLLGFGSSDKPQIESDYSPKANAERVRKLLSHLSVQEYGIMMHDMGGLVAWEIMRAAPDEVTHAVILNTIAADEGFNQPQLIPGAISGLLMNAYSSNGPSSLILAKTFEELGLQGAQKLTEDECYGYVKPLLEGSDAALYAFFTGIDKQFFADLELGRQELSSWRGKALILWGGLDETLTSDQIPIIQSVLSVSDEHIVVYPDHAHFLPEEIPNDIAARTIQFMLGETSLESSDD